ncbi:MAG: hypothetical protein ACTHU0_01365 [Kofleriaceae bacterium]
MRFAMAALAVCSSCALDEDPEATSCSTTLWAERPYTGPIVFGEANPRTEIYAAAVTVREIAGTPCAAEAALNRKEPPLAWSHACGCPKPASSTIRWQAAKLLSDDFCQHAGTQCASVRVLRWCPEGATGLCNVPVDDQLLLDRCIAIAAPLRDTAAMCSDLFR